MATSPTQRSLKFLRDRGMTCSVVEYWHAFAHVRIDLFGFIDIIVLNPDEPGVIGVQCTSYSNMSARVKKIQGIPEAKTWLKTGNHILVYGWKKGKNGRWEVVKRRLILSPSGDEILSLAV